jgi:hypothetical protein
MSIHLRLVPRLRIRGAIHPLPPHGFVVWCLINLRDIFASVRFRKALSQHITEAEGQIRRSSKEEKRK